MLVPEVVAVGVDSPPRPTAACHIDRRRRRRADVTHTTSALVRVNLLAATLSIEVTPRLDSIVIDIAESCVTLPVEAATEISLDHIPAPVPLRRTNLSLIDLFTGALSLQKTDSARVAESRDYSSRERRR